MSHEKYQECIQSCLNCLAACNHCYNACLDEDHVQMMVYSFGP